jgi:hypothetical protein
VNGNAPGPHGSPHGASCTGCHQPVASKHTFEVDLAYCATCHTVGGPYDLAPKKHHLETAADELYAALQAYGTANGKSICYNGGAHPYFFDGTLTANCTTGLTTANQALLNPTALKAAYNLKWAHAEPGAYAHNFEYMEEVLYDSIVSLGATPTFTPATR